MVLAHSPLSGLINLVIIAIGLRQAWRLTTPFRAPVVGPYAARRPIQERRTPANILSMCPSCSTTLPPLALSCPSCRQLVHAQELESLSQQAKVAEAGGSLTDARAAWARALTMLPQGTVQSSAVAARLADLDARLAPAAAEATGGCDPLALGQEVRAVRPARRVSLEVQSHPAVRRDQRKTAAARASPT